MYISYCAGYTSFPLPPFWSTVLYHASCLCSFLATFLIISTCVNLIWGGFLLNVNTNWMFSKSYLHVFGQRQVSNVMLWLYHSLICFMIDYGSFVYGSATKSAIVCHRHCSQYLNIHITTGACLESLFAKYGVTLLFLWRSVLHGSCAVKLASQSQHPSHDALLHSTSCNRYNLM